MVPGKSFAISVRTGHVWHPIGMPSGAACSRAACDAMKPMTAVSAAVFLKNSRLDIGAIDLLPLR
jgi:hypothetical protein